MNAKIYNGNVQPNPKEFKIWVNDEGTIKTWNGTKWVELSGGSSSSGSGSSSSDGATMEYYHIDYDNAYLSEIISTKGISWLNSYIFDNFNIIKYEDRWHDITSTGSGNYIRMYESGDGIKALDVACVNVPTAISGEVLQGDTWLDSIKDYCYEITDWSWLVPITKEEFFDFIN